LGIDINEEIFYKYYFADYHFAVFTIV